MLLYRCRQYGDANWTSIIVQGEEDSDLPEIISSVIGSALSTSSLHVQFLNEDDEWEDLE